MSRWQAFAWMMAASMAVVRASARIEPALLSGSALSEASKAITELDVGRARQLLSDIDSETPAVAFERARLAIYTGDCDSARATLSALPDSPEVQSLSDLAKTCARATAAAVLVEDKEHGVWVRLQNDEDRPLVPYLAGVAAKARSVVENDFGVRLPRPLRIDLVRDLFSLSAVSGLSVEAAETTGTVAVARWGRVTMLSPRAATHGYPWEDTLAHEITHLALSRATRDHAPLWLQEGLAKREETRWRKERPFDGEPSADGVAHRALVTGQAVGVDHLGPSIAMLPTPEAATIAFAEVQSFMSFWIDQNGVPSLHLLLADLKGLGNEGADSALKSTSGYDLEQWITLWRAHLLSSPPEGTTESAGGETEDNAPNASPRELSRAVRLEKLLFDAGAFDDAAERIAPAASATDQPLVLWRAGRALLAAGRQDEAAEHFRSIDQVSSGHAGWYGLRGRLVASAGDEAKADRMFSLAVALDPFLEDAACEGFFDKPGEDELPLPRDPRRRALCEAARKIPRE